ncbi:MAG: acireductone synthase [Bacteroidota bacterium]
MIQFILMDIEGTTTSISFVHEVLFPYASKHLEGFVTKNQNDHLVLAELEAVKKTVLEEDDKEMSNDEAIQQLLTWIKADRKHTALKALQGYLWKEGYVSGEYTGHVYEDVLPVLEKWKQAGLKMGIYSSGSVEAQKLLFKYSKKGDLTPYLSAHFDTNIGHKKEVHSYRNIQESLNIPADHILFLSDVEAELDAAQEAGFQTIQLVRPGTTASEKHTTVNQFDEISL